MTFIKLICFYLFLGICILEYNAKKRYKVHRDFNDKKEIKILNPEKIKAHFERCDEDRLLKMDFGHDILHFKNTLLFKVPKKHLNILYKNLKTLETKENIIKFITNLDFILKYSDILYIPNFLFGKNKIYVEEKLKIRIKEIEETLTKWYLKKIQNDIKEKLITNEDALIDIKEFYNSITEHELLEKLNITNKNIEDYSEIKMLKKRIQA